MSYHIPCFYEINRCMFHLLTGEIVVKIYNFPITAHLPTIFCVLVFDYVKLRPPPTTPPLETSKFIVGFRFDHVKSPLYRSTLLPRIGPSRGHETCPHQITPLPYHPSPRNRTFSYRAQAFCVDVSFGFLNYTQNIRTWRNFAENSAVNRKVTVSFVIFWRQKE